jgi:hypothetical protein
MDLAIRSLDAVSVLRLGTARGVLQGSGLKKRKRGKCETTHTTTTTDNYNNNDGQLQQQRRTTTTTTTDNNNDNDWNDLRLHETAAGVLYIKQAYINVYISLRVSLHAGDSETHSWWLRLFI